jgi:hypothetical protein
MVCLLGLAALAVTVSPAHGQGRSMRMPQTPTVRQFPRNTPMTAQTFVQPRRFSANQFEGTRFNRFEDRFERRFPVGRFDRFEDRFERRFGFDPLLGSPFALSPFQRGFVVNPLFVP